MRALDSLAARTAVVAVLATSASSNHARGFAVKVSRPTTNAPIM